MKNKKVLFQKSVKYALTGMITFFLKERNGQIQLAVSVLAIAFSFIFSITKSEWIAVLILCMAVIATEMLNTAVEKLCDRVTTEYDEIIKVVKDISAGAVLLVSLLAVIIGLMIFVPYLTTCFQ